MVIFLYVMLIYFLPEKSNTSTDKKQGNYWWNSSQYIYTHMYFSSRLRDYLLYCVCLCVCLRMLHMFYICNCVLCVHVQIGWADQHRQKEFFLNFAKKNNFEPNTPESWYGIRNKQFRKAVCKNENLCVWLWVSGCEWLSVIVLLLLSYVYTIL